MESLGIIISLIFSIGSFVVMVKIGFNDLKHLQKDFNELKSEFKDHQKTVWERIDELKENGSTRDIAIAQLQQQIKDKLPNGNK